MECTAGMGMRTDQIRPGYHIESLRFFRAFGIIPQALFYLTYRDNNKRHDIADTTTSGCWQILLIPFKDKRGLAKYINTQ